MLKQGDSLTVDRVEDGIAVVETKSGMMQLPLNKLPPGTREGSVLYFNGEGFELDTVSEVKRRGELFKKQQYLFRQK